MITKYLLVIVWVSFHQEVPPDYFNRLYDTKAECEKYRKYADYYLTDGSLKAWCFTKKIKQG